LPATPDSAAFTDAGIAIAAMAKIARSCRFIIRLHGRALYAVGRGQYAHSSSARRRPRARLPYHRTNQRKLSQSETAQIAKLASVTGMPTRACRRQSIVTPRRVA